MYLIIDNYDSFTYNLFQYLSELTAKPIKVIRNDKITIAEIERMDLDGIILSPGPGRPEEAGISVEVIRHFAGHTPILGVCLGHQAVGYAYGATIIQAKNIVHGKVEPIKTDGKGLFRNIPSPAPFTRYHSLVIDPQTLPDCLEITAHSQDGEIMGVRHKDYPIEAVQFHPESIASDYGKKLLKNFLNYKKESFDVKEILSQVMKGKDLSQAQAQDMMEELTDGELNKSQIAAYLTALNVKGFTPEEIAGSAAVLRRKKLAVAKTQPVLDTCGTGGDELGTFNISSFAALIAAACGAKVAKHGNRCISSLCGSADFYSHLGLPTDLKPEQAAQLIEKTNFSFLFAPMYHSAMKHAMPVRKELGLKTIFNCLGPLANPADAEYQLIGVYADELCLPIARAAKLLGVRKIMVVHGQEGLDEISVCGPTRIVEIQEEQEEQNYLVRPEDLGLKTYPLAELKGGEPAENTELALDLLAGNGREAIKAAVLVNAGAGLYVYGLATSIKNGYELARAALESGKVTEKIAEIKKTAAALVGQTATN